MPTPTAAAELITEFNYQLQDKFTDYKRSINRIIYQKIESFYNYLVKHESRLKNPLTKVREISQSIDNVDLRLQQSQKFIITNYKNKIQLLLSDINNLNPEKKLFDLNNKVDLFNELLQKGISLSLKNFTDQLTKFKRNLDILSPLSILDRGYAIVTNKNGKAIKSFKDVTKDELLTTRLSQGSIDVSVQDTNE